MHPSLRRTAAQAVVLSAPQKGNMHAAYRKVESCLLKIYIFIMNIAAAACTYFPVFGDGVCKNFLCHANSK